MLPAPSLLPLKRGDIPPPLPPPLPLLLALSPMPPAAAHAAMLPASALPSAVGAADVASMDDTSV